MSQYERVKEYRAALVAALPDEQRELYHAALAAPTNMEYGCAVPEADAFLKAIEHRSIEDRIDLVSALCHEKPWLVVSSAFKAFAMKHVEEIKKLVTEREL